MPWIDSVMFRRSVVLLLASFWSAASAVDAAAKELEKYMRLLDWMQVGVDEHVPAKWREGLPALADVIAMRYDADRGRHMVAKTDLQEGQLLMRLPIHRLMHSGYYKGPEPAKFHSATNVSTGALAKALHEGLKGQELFTFVATQTWLALFILEQKRLGSKSEWAPYIDVLPATYPTLPLYYTDEDWKWLNGSTFKYRVDRHRGSLQNQYNTVAEYVPDFKATYTFEEFLWARSAISSRVFGWSLPGLNRDDNDFMVPLGDMFNHRSPKQIEWIYNSTTETLDYWMRENVTAGQELLISYGSKCNSVYLLHYGFALPNVSSRTPSPSSVRLLMYVDEAVEDRNHRVRWLMRKRLKESDGELEPEEFELTATGGFGRAGAAERMLGYARLLSLPGGADFEKTIQRRSSCRPFLTPPRCDSPMSLDNEKAAVRRCLGAVEKALGAYPSSRQEDDKLLEELEAKPMQRFLTLLRRDEKVVLEVWRQYWNVALEAFEIPDGPAGDDVEAFLESVVGKHYPKFSAEGQYVRVTLSALLSVERKTAEAKASKPPTELEL